MNTALIRLETELNTYIDVLVDYSHSLDVSTMSGEETFYKVVANVHWAKSRLKEVKNMQVGRKPDQDYEV